MALKTSLFGRHLLFISIFLQSVSGFAFDEPNFLSCINNATVKVSHRNNSETFKNTNFKIDLSKVSVIEITKGDKILAKLFPRNGLDWVIKEKGLSVSSDERRFWALQNGQGLGPISTGKLSQLVSCELVHE